jgi:hypothetical protein
MEVLLRAGIELVFHTVRIYTFWGNQSESWPILARTAEFAAESIIAAQIDVDSVS